MFDSRLVLAALPLVVSWLGCQSERRDYAEISPAVAPIAATSGSPDRAATASAAVSPSALALPSALTRSEFAALIEAGSEKSEYFFSDNLISNETAYQKPSQLMTQLVVPGQAYLGVGPEQNFTFIGLVDPGIAFIVDLRRDNLLQHLWYKALFELAETRTEYLCLWLGREYEPKIEPGPAASIDEVVIAVERSPKSTATFARAGALIDERLRDAQVTLSAADRRRIHDMRQTFFQRQLALRFELHQATAHDYPTLERLLKERDDTGTARSFLADETAFRRVQLLQRQNLLVPLVGNFAGDRALATVAREVERRGLTLALFYTSNVEQYLFEGDSWGPWVHNLAALPTDERSLLARVHLDQIRAHPAQLAGHRSTMVFQRFEQFFEHQRKRPYRNAFELVTLDLVLVPER
jgi:hypothetical protein